jgi:hypothetical protein
MSIFLKVKSCNDERKKTMVIHTYFLSELEREAYERAILERMKGIDEEGVVQLDDAALLKVYNTCIEEKIRA